MKTIEESKLDTVKLFYKLLEKEVINLSLHKFGNFVIQKIIERGYQTILSSMRESFKGKIVLLSKNIYACRVIQKLAKFTENVMEQKSILEELHEDVSELIHDSSANHVIQMIIETFDTKLLQGILLEITYHVHTLF